MFWGLVCWRAVLCVAAAACPRALWWPFLLVCLPPQGFFLRTEGVLAGGSLRALGTG